MAGPSNSRPLMNHAKPLLGILKRSQNQKNAKVMLAAVTVALRRAMEGLSAPPKLIEALAVKTAVGATQP
ncbi:hypothetical protein EB232_19295 [Mesorhizobium sp. NZP2077]|nr:hypothetical protein EB232_19295 [Mesorhizobium sp. NZP2077]